VARKSSYRRFGKDFINVPGPGGGGADGENPPEESARKEPASSAGGSRFVAVVLFLACVGLAIGLFFSLQDAGNVRKRHALSGEIGSLYLEGMNQFSDENFTGARETLKKALVRANEYQFESPDSYMAAFVQEIDSVLKKPAIVRGKSGSRAQKWADFRKIVKELEPTDIYLQLGEKAGAVLEEHVRRMEPKDIGALVPELVDKLVDQKISDLDPKELTGRLGDKADAIFQERLSGITINSLRMWLKDRLVELVRSEIERRRYDGAAMDELLGERRADVARSFIEGVEAKELAELIERRFDEIERLMAEKIVKRQARITLDDGTVWEGQILHDGPLNLRFLRNNGDLYAIPKSRIKKTEPLLQPKEPKKEPLQPQEPEKESEPPSEK